MGRLTPEQRDQVLDMLGRREGYPEPDYQGVSARVNRPVSSLRSMVHRDKKRNGTQRDATGRADLPPGSGDVRVTEKQAVAAGVIAAGGTRADAAEAAEVSERQVYRWQQDPGFEAYRADRAAEWRDGQLEGLRRAAAEAIEKLLEKIPDMTVDQLQRLAVMALDRTGVPKTERVESANLNVNVEPDLTDEELEERLRRAEERAALADRIIDAECEEVEHG